MGIGFGRMHMELEEAVTSAFQISGWKQIIYWCI